MRTILQSMFLLASFIVGFTYGHRTDTERTDVRNSSESANYQQGSESPGRMNPASSKKETSSELPPTGEQKGTATAITRILEAFLPFLSDDQLVTLVDIAVHRDGDSQRAILDLLYEEDDPEYYELIRGFGIAYQEELLDRVVDAFETEAHPARRAELAQALGNLAWHLEAMHHIESILVGRDAVLLERVLGHLTVDGVIGAREAAVIPLLRDLARSGPTVEVRAGAAGALQGDESEEGIQFLVNLVVKDPVALVQERALDALYINSELPEDFRRGVLATLYGAVTDPNRSFESRRRLAREVRSYLGLRKLWSEEQKEVLMGLRGQED